MRNYTLTQLGIIPARAGFTRVRARYSPQHSDHPRSRGVYLIKHEMNIGPQGSSPLARGLRVIGDDISAHCRIIPARAGFTLNSAVRLSLVTDHPRSRGVYLCPTASHSPFHGSSPLARGLRPEARLIAESAGSSPLARGLQAVFPPVGHRVRIIPARAGFTLSLTRRMGSLKDHPRSRGVYSRRRPILRTAAGSSPLARGLRAEDHGLALLNRIIPARAGFTPTPSSRSSPTGDHPRSRGVYKSRGRGPVLKNGSSPLARGLRADLSRDSRMGGIIPARAGFTLADPWNPNEPTLYQTPAAFTADLGPAPPGRDSAVEFGAALSAAGRAGRDLAAAGLRPWFGHHPDMHRRVATTSG